MPAHIRRILITILASAMVLLASCATEPPATPPPTATSKPAPTVVPPAPTFVAGLANSPEQILGTWGYPGWAFMRLARDGMLSQAATREELDATPFAVCKFWFSGSQLLIKEVKVRDVPSCGARTGRYQVELLAPDRIRMVVVEDRCEARANDLAGEYTRVE
ncbi:MAG: hypothetical protein NTY23_07740 [Chloroflexi bacterium]|nr:hypothetical protein [Chloroflexota bacterium]